MTETLAMTLVYCSIGFIIVSCLFGFIMKHFIREAIKEALEDCGISKRKTDQTW